MGKYQKQMYEERDLALALAKVHGIIDDDVKKLSDKVHELELSQNRKKKLLSMAHDFLHKLVLFYAVPADLLEVLEYLHKRLTLELYGMENYVELKGKRNEKNTYRNR